MANAWIPDPSDAEIAPLVLAAARGEHGASDRLYALLYESLRRRASALLRRQTRGPTFQTTDLVHEAYARLAFAGARPQRAGAFYALASRAMRSVLVDHARRRGRVKRGDGRRPDALASTHVGLADRAYDVLEIDDLLRRLGEIDDRAAMVVEQRVFGGCTLDEIADGFSVTRRTIDRDWAFAKAWLAREIA